MPMIRGVREPDVGGREEDAIVLFGSDRKAKSQAERGRRRWGRRGRREGAEEANPAPPPSFAKLTKQQRKLKKPCIPRPNVD